MSDTKRAAIEWGLPLAISILAVGARYCFNADRLSIVGLIRAVVMGLFVGMEVNLYMLGQYHIAPETRGAIIGLAVAISNELFIILITAIKDVVKNPQSVVNRILTALFGRGGK